MPTIPVRCQPEAQKTPGHNPDPDTPIPSAQTQHLAPVHQTNHRVVVEAAKIYAEHPAALQLRAMNIIYETTKERGATILIPMSMVDSMNPASALVLAAQRTLGEGFPSLKNAA